VINGPKEFRDAGIHSMAGMTLEWKFATDRGLGRWVMLPARGSNFEWSALRSVTWMNMTFCGR